MRARVTCVRGKLQLHFDGRLYMAKPVDGTQMEGRQDLAVAVQATNDAVALVLEAETSLRRCRAAERLARRLEAEARAAHRLS